MLRVALALILTVVCLALRGEGLNDDFGLLYDSFPLTLGQGHRVEAVGPLFSYERKGSETTWGFHPILSGVSDPETDSREVDFLYPVLTYDRFGLEYKLQFFQLISFAGGQTMDLHDKRRVTLFPIYFQQRSPEPELNYTAVVPFYGHLKNRFFRDEVSFVMLPVYMQTRKREVITDNYLVPFFHLRHGPGLKGWQLWPLAGSEHKDVTTTTNLYGDVESVGGHDKLFAMWPLFFRNDLGVGTTNQQTQRLLLPLYSSQKSPARDTTSYLWPLGYTYTEDREKQYREWGAPWPLIAFARGKGKTLNRVFPFFSHGETATAQSDFYAWPVYRYNRVTSEVLDRERTRILFFLYSDVVERNTNAGTVMQRTDLWPLFSARREHNGNERLQLIAPLEALLRGNAATERNYSPVWSVWVSEKNKQTGATSQSLLWNLYRRETTETTRKCSLLFGLFHYQSGLEGKRWRVFYIPFGKRASH